MCMKKFLYFCIVGIICVAVILFIPGKNNKNSHNISKDGSSNEKRLEYIRSYGWEVSPIPKEKTLTLIPEVFSSTLEDYNNMQLKSGFDLKPLCGKEIVRFSYRLLNHPLDKNYARVNIFVYKGEIVAADVSSTKLDGFMHSIEKKNFD